MISLLLAALITVFVPTPPGEIVTVTLRAERGTIGDVFALEADNANDTPACGVGRGVRVCRVTASALTQLVVEWSPYPARCGQQPTLTATDDQGRVLLWEVTPLPAGMSCVRLPTLEVP